MPKFLIVTGAGYRLPFVTTRVEVREVTHRHTNPDGSTWNEPQVLTRSFPDMLLSAIIPASNDNEMIYEPA